MRGSVCIGDNTIDRSLVPASITRRGAGDASIATFLERRLAGAPVEEHLAAASAQGAKGL